jgi:uncharacterized protein (TIGR02145 family)
MRDGMIYKTVTIGNQVWMAENLRAKKYLNGDPIPYGGNDIIAWNQLTTGAYCFYNNDSLINAFNYGGLYNYYTIIDSRGVCPTGWHSPKVTEFQNLITYLGGDSIAGGKLKAIGNLYWTGLNVGALSTAICLGLNTNGAKTLLPNNPTKTQGFSVRCIKD